MPENTEQPQPNLKEIKPEKAVVIENIGRRIDDYFSQVLNQAKLAEADIEPIRGKRNLDEILEIGNEVFGQIRRSEMGGPTVDEIERGVRRAIDQTEEQVQKISSTFGDKPGGFGEFFDLTRKKVGEWEAGEENEFKDRIRKVLSEKDRPEQDLQDLREEFKKNSIQKIKDTAADLRNKSRSFEGESYELGDQIIRGLSRAQAEIEGLPSSSELYRRIAERVETMYQEARAYFISKSGEARMALPSRFNKVEELTTNFEEDLKKLFETLL